MSEVPVLLPELAPSMTAGNIVRWLKTPGAAVKKGEALVEIETDKAIAELEAEHDGRLTQILIPDGTQSVPINTVIAILEREGVSAPAVAEPGAPCAPDSATANTALAGASAERGDGGRVRASPLARRLAHEAGIELKGVTGSGPGGRVVRADIQALSVRAQRSEDSSAIAAPRAATSAPGPAIAHPRMLIERLGIPYRAEPISNMRRIIARRLTESKQSIPHCYLSVECRMDKLMGLRTDLNAVAEAPRLSVNDFVVLAAARALHRVPAMNATWTDEAILRYQRVDLAVAVSTSSGLLTPVLTDAASLTLFEVSTRLRELIERARAGKLRAEEYQGGTFSLTNLGTHAIRSFSAIINPPHGGILAVGAAEARPVVACGAIAVGTVMSCTVSFDHRVVDGAQAAEFLRAVQIQLEAPAGLLR
jgi:pyruvate dehydrogenase E2 component (dihydrolipoamide acetyltransferase)